VKRNPILFVCLGASILALTLGCSSLPFLRATPTPTSTPSPTPTLTPTSTPTAAPTVTSTPASLVFTRPQADGSTEFTDDEIGYSLILPPEWIVLNLEAEDLAAAIQMAGRTNPDLAPLLEYSAAAVSQGTRLLAFDPDPEQMAAGYPPNIVLVSLDNPGLSLEYQVQTAALSIEAILPESRLLSSEMMQALNGRPAGRIEMTMPVTTMAGSQVTIRSTWILAEASGQLLELTLQSEASGFPSYAEEFEGVIQSWLITAP
jgi:hypothetical protein